MKKYVLVAAGGLGSRMNNPVPKQFAVLDDMPLLFHTLNRFLSYAPDIELILVLPEDYIPRWEKLCAQHHFTVRHQLATGGPTRFHSVKNGLRLVPDDAVVAIHDAARPNVSPELIARVFSAAIKFGSAIPVVGLNESVRQVDGPLSSPVDRTKLRIVQTPQCFVAAAIKKAYNCNYHERFTDDASVYEADGQRLFLIEGQPDNIKITTATDLTIARVLLSQQIKPDRPAE